MAQTSRILLTGGTHNRVLCSHSTMCHHCGYIGGGETPNVCSECGIRTHEGCVPSFNGGMCDGCRFPSDECCEICRVSNHAPSSEDVDRLVTIAAFHGRRWTRGEDDERPCLPEDCEIAQRLSLDPETLFQPSHLPEGVTGCEPMRVMVDGVSYLSHPMMVHSWCVQSVFQFHPAPTGSSSWQSVVEAIDAPRQGSFAETSTQCKMGLVNTASPCAFCNSCKGHQVFCYGHTNSSRGCTNCNWNLRPHFTYTSFHPSCAVRAGMYRVIDPIDGGSGMMCRKSMSAFLPKVHRLQRTRQTSSRVQRVERWLEQSSGFHMDVASRIDPITLPMDLSQTLPVVGARYDTFPIARARRVVHKRHRAENVHNGTTEVLQDVSEQPHGGTYDADTTSRTEDEHTGDRRNDYHDQSGENRSETGELPNGSMGGGTGGHSSTVHRQSMSLEESSELIRTLTCPRLLEAIDVRVEYLVRHIVHHEMEAERGIRACRELCEE